MDVPGKPKETTHLSGVHGILPPKTSHNSLIAIPLYAPELGYC